MTAARTLTVIVCSLLIGRCGGTPSGPSAAPAATITITSTGLVPSEVRIGTGERVQFVNNDTRPHEITSDPVQVHTDCPGMNDVGLLSPGQSRSSGTLIVARTCGFHDHTNEFDATWKGRVIVQ